MNKHLIVIGVVILLLVVGLSGCYESDTEYTTDLPSADDVQILSHNLSYTSYGSVVVIGTAKNIGEERLSFIEIKAKFYDENDILIETSSDMAEDVDANEIFAFEIYCFEDEVFIDHYSIGIGTVM